MTALAELSRLIRSKNAGPFELTFDIMFDDVATYERVKLSGAVSREAVAARYGVAVEDVKFFFCDHAYAIKASIRVRIFRAIRATATDTAASNMRR